LGSAKIKLTWKKVKGAKGYAVYRATSKKGKYIKAKTLKKGSNIAYTNSKLKRGKTYYYKVCAYKVVHGIKVYGDFSKIVSKRA